MYCLFAWTLVSCNADFIKADSSKPPQSNSLAAINKGKVRRNRGYFARLSRAGGGGTSSFFKNAHQSHSNLLAAFRQLFDSDISLKAKYRAHTPSAPPTPAAITIRAGPALVSALQNLSTPFLKQTRSQSHTKQDAVPSTYPYLK